MAQSYWATALQEHHIPVRNVLYYGCKVWPGILCIWATSTINEQQEPGNSGFFGASPVGQQLGWAMDKEEETQRHF